MPVNALRDYLDENEVEYVTISHSRAYTAQRIAAAAHVPGKEMAKTVMLKVDGSLVMAVLRAPDKVNLSKVKEITGADKVELAKEGEFEKSFPDCEVGSMPPFGNLYDLEVLVDSNLTKDEHIVFNACSHRELIRMPYESYANLVQPKIADIAFGA
jgi:Ala-tRNA(Pro) deacylase